MGWNIEKSKVYKRQVKSTLFPAVVFAWYTAGYSLRVHSTTLELKLGRQTRLVWDMLGRFVSHFLGFGCNNWAEFSIWAYPTAS